MRCQEEICFGRVNSFVIESSTDPPYCGIIDRGKRFFLCVSLCGVVATNARLARVCLSSDKIIRIPRGQRIHRVPLAGDSSIQGSVPLIGCGGVGIPLSLVHPEVGVGRDLSAQPGQGDTIWVEPTTLALGPIDHH
jgi:hypothetical protein